MTLGVATVSGESFVNSSIHAAPSHGQCSARALRSLAIQSLSKMAPGHLLRLVRKRKQSFGSLVDLSMFSKEETVQ